jgi:hypothetical protein
MPIELDDADLDLVSGGQNTVTQSTFVESNNNTAANYASTSSGASVPMAYEPVLQVYLKSKPSSRDFGWLGRMEMCSSIPKRKFGDASIHGGDRLVVVANSFQPSKAASKFLIHY